MKNYYRSSSVEGRLGNTGLGTEVSEVQIYWEDIHKECFRQTLNSRKAAT
jgi:hypothetical protein